MLLILGGHFGVTRAALRQVVHPAVPVSDDHITGHGFSGRRGVTLVRTWLTIPSRDGLCPPASKRVRR